MGKNRLVAVSEVQAPNFNILVGRAADENAVVRGNIYGEHRQFVAIERERKIIRI
jgi:hypothetical protein